jgi:hypothetical protein
MPEKANSQNDVILEIDHFRKYKVFSCIDGSLNVIMKMKIVMDQLLNKLE